MDTSLLIIGALVLWGMHSSSGSSAASGDAGATADAGPGTVSKTTTSTVVDNKATRTGSTAVELSNDAVIVASDGLDIFKAFRDASSDDS